MLKIDLPKAYDQVNWLHIRLLLTHLGFEVPFINRAMSCITSVSFVVLFNGSASLFFRAKGGLRQGFPLSPLLFLMVAEGLSHSLFEAKRTSGFKGIHISQPLFIYHLPFVDDILIFCDCTRRDADKWQTSLVCLDKPRV